jgi:hypothetical protein
MSSFQKICAIAAATLILPVLGFVGLFLVVLID